MLERPQIFTRRLLPTRGEQPSCGWMEVASARSDVAAMSPLSMPPQLDAGPSPPHGVYEARRKRTEWPEGVRMDDEVKALDERNGEWILCRTCAEHYERCVLCLDVCVHVLVVLRVCVQRAQVTGSLTACVRARGCKHRRVCRTGRGRKPNDPEGFKVKMNGRFQEAAWIMHKNRVVAHKTAHDGSAPSVHGGNDSSSSSSGSQAGGSPLATLRDRDAFLRDHDAMGMNSSGADCHVTSSSSIGSDGPDDEQLDHPHPHDSREDPHEDPHLHHPAKRLKTVGSGSESDDAQQASPQHHHHHVGALDLVVGEGHDSSGPFFMEEMKLDDGESPLSHVSGASAGHLGRSSIQLPRTGWRCPGVVPDFFYQANAELVHAFAKYYVGSYRVNVVRDIRSDKYVLVHVVVGVSRRSLTELCVTCAHYRVMLYSHDCENRIVHRERPNQPISCDKCYAIWLHNKSFKRILKKMDRYNLVEDILRRSWSITDEDLSVLSKFKHSSGANLNIEGRKLKQAAITVLKRFNARKAPAHDSNVRMHHQQQQQHQQHLQQQHAPQPSHSQQHQQLAAVLGLPLLETAAAIASVQHVTALANERAAVSPASLAAANGVEHRHQPLLLIAHVPPQSVQQNAMV